MVNQLTSYPAAVRQSLAVLIEQHRSPRNLVRLAMLAGLPVAILVGSPQRVSLSALIAAAYVGAALFTSRLGRANRLMLAYVVVAAAYMVVAWLRTKYLLHLTPEQLSY